MYITSFVTLSSRIEPPQPLKRGVLGYLEKSTEGEGYNDI